MTYDDISHTVYGIVDVVGQIIELVAEPERYESPAHAALVP